MAVSKAATVAASTAGSLQPMSLMALGLMGFLAINYLGGKVEGAFSDAYGAYGAAKEGVSAAIDFTVDTAQEFAGGFVQGSKPRYTYPLTGQYAYSGQSPDASLAALLEDMAARSEKVSRVPSPIPLSGSAGVPFDELLRADSRAERFGGYLGDTLRFKWFLTEPSDLGFVEIPSIESMADKIDYAASFDWLPW